MSSYRKLARKQAFRLGLAVTAMVGGMTGWHTAAYADGATDIQKMDAANAGTITTSNNVWTVVPDKVEGDLATNAFSKFILDQNNVANLQMYKGGATANTLVNMVQGHIDIRGTVNVLRNATTIGGNVFFLSPEGMAVGRTGVINAGSITALTPSTDWFNDHLQDNRVKVTAADMDALKAGTIPLNADASIVIDGQLNAQSGIHLGAPAITVGSAASAAAQLTNQKNLDFAALVNAGSTSAGLGTLTATTGAGGDIVLAAASNRLNSTTDDVPKYANPLSGSKNEIKAELTVGTSAAITGDRNVVLSSYAEHTADQSEAFGGTSSNTSAQLLGQIVKTTAHTTVNGRVTADGRLSATAKAKNIASEAGPLSNAAGLADEVAGVIAVNVDPSYMIMGSEATVKIGADAALTAKGADVTVTQDGKTVVQERALIVGADARSSVDAGATTSKIKFANIKHTNAVPAMAVAYAKAQSAANVTVEGHLTAEQGSVDVHAKSREDLIAAAHAKTTQLGAGADSTQLMNVAVLVARGNNDAQVKIGQGAVVTAEKQADITADATTKLETSASASGKENSLLNVAVNVTKQTSAAHTEVRGAVTGKTAANIYAHNTQLKNSVEASTAAGKSGMVTYFSNAAANTNTVTGLTQKIKNVIGGIRSKIGFPSDGLSSPTELDKLGEKISLGGAVNVLNDEQQADVLLAPHAVIRSDGAVKIEANSTICGTHVRAQSAVNSQTDPNWYLTKDGKTEKVQAGQTEETQGMGSFAVNVANIKNTAGVTTLAAEESGTSYAPNITGKTVDITADGHILYTNIDDMISELRASFKEFKQHCAAFQGAHAGTLTAAQDKANAYLAKCDNDPAYIVSKEGLKEAKELAAAIKAVADVLKEDVTIPANLAERALAFADPSNYLTFQASAKFSGKGPTQEKPDAEQAKIAGAAGVNFADVDNHAAVVLGRGTKVTAADEVTVAASSKKQLVTLVGAPAWQAGADIAIGGNLGITVGDTTADTIVAEGTEITGKKAAIKATNSYDGIHLAVAAGKGGKIGFQGMANYVGGTSGAVTSVDDEAKIAAATAAQMNALNTTNITNIAGSAVLGTGAAIGLSAALNNIAQTSIAAIADNDAAEETPQDKTAEQRTEKQIRAAQKRAVQPFGDANAADLYGTAAKKMAGAVQAETLDVHAEQKGVINAAAAAGAIATGDDTSEKGGIFDKIGQTVTTGKNMVGNGITKIDNKLQDLVGSSLKKQAEKKTVPINAVKNLGFNQKQPPFTLDLAGSASVNLSKVTTAAEVKGANVTLTKNAASPAAMKNLTVSAQDSSFTGAWGGALAVTWKTTTKSQNEDSANAGIAGAASVNVQRHRDVLALMSDNRIKGADSIENVAVQKGATVAAALGLSVMKTSGNTVTSTAVPVSLTYNEGGSVTLAQMRDNYINAAADGTALTGIQKTALSNRAVSSNTQVSGGVSAGLVFGSKSSNAVGAVVAVSNLRNDVHADISQTRKDTGALRNIGALTNEAVSGMTQIGAAIGVGAASGSEHAAAVTGSFAVNNFANKTAAQLTRVTLTADSANVRADDKHEAGAYQQYLEERGIETSGDKYQEDFAKGKSNSSLAVDQDGNLTHSGGSTIVTAAASISAAAGSSAATAAGIGVGVGVIKNDFTAGVSGSDLELKGAQGLNVESVADTRAINVAAGVAGSGGIAAAGSASVIATDNETSAIVEDSTIKAQKLQANALTKSLLVNVAGQISVSAGGAGVAAGLATAVNMIDNNTTAALRGGRLTLSHDGIVNLNAQNIGGIEALTAGVAAGTQAAVSGAISVNVGKNDTCAEIAQYEVTKGRMVDAEIRGAKSVRATTLDQTRQDAAVGGVSASTQGGAVGASVAFNALLGQQNTARISGAKIGLVEGGMVDVNAKNEGTLNTVALNVAGSGGSVAFAGAAAVADVAQDTTAEIVSSDIEAEAGKTAGDVTVQADGKLTARTFAIVGSGSSEGAAIGAGVAVNLLNADTNAVISGGKIHAANVITDAAGNLNLHNIGMGVAATGSGAAVSGSIAVNKLNNDTTAKIAGGAKVTAEKNAAVAAKSDDRIQNYAGQLTVAGTGAAIGLATGTNIIGSNTKAEISGSGTEVISHATDGVAATQLMDGLNHEKLYNGSLTVNTLGALIGLDGLAEGRKATKYRGVAVSASATHTANSFIANGGGTGTGASVIGTVNTNIVGGSTTAQIADATAKAAGANVSVRADDATNSGALVGTVSVAGEGAAFGTGSSINLINRTTEAEAARSTITAKNAAITARSAQGIAALTAGVSFADEFGLANSNNFVRMEQSTRAALMNSTVNVSGLSVTADNTANLNAFAKTLGTAGYGGAVGIGTATLLDRSKTEADIAGTKVVYTDDQGETLVRAKNTEDLNNYVFSAAGAGITGVGASIGGGDVKNTVKAAVTGSTLGHAKANDTDPEAETAAKRITVTAENNVHFDQMSGTIAGGGVGASVGVSVNNFKATVESVVNNSKLYAREAADITAHDSKNITQLATNGAGGIAAVGLNVMVTNVGADMQKSYTMEEGSSGKKQSVNAQEYTDKTAEMNTNAQDRSKKGLSYVSTDEKESAKMLAEEAAPSTDAKTSARAEQSDILVATSGSNGKTRAGELNISAQSSDNISQNTVQAGIGGAVVSGAAGIVRNRSNVETVAAGGTLSAHTIKLDAVKDGAAKLKIYQGAAAGLAVNAAYGELNMGGRNDLVLSDTKMRAHTITGTTRDETTGAVDIIGVAASLGGAAANILVGNAHYDNAQTLRAERSTLTADGDLTLSMTRTAKTAGDPTLRTTTAAASGGMSFAGNGVAALARETGSMTMNLVEGNTLSAAGDLALKTDNRANIQAETKAVSASIFAAATATYASASFGTEKNAYQNRILIGVEDQQGGKTDGENSLTGKTITISAETNAQERAHLKALSASAGAGVQASGANINAYSDAKTLLASRTNYRTAVISPTSAQPSGVKELQISTKNIHTQDLDARGIAAGGLFATATNYGAIKNVLHSDTTAYGTGSYSILNNAALTTHAEAVKKGKADGSGGALVAISPIAAWISDDTTLSAKTKLMGTWNLLGALDAKASTYDNSLHDVDALQAAIVGGSGTQLTKKISQNAAVTAENAAITSVGAQNYEAKNRFSHADRDAASGYGAGTLNAGAVSATMTEAAKITFKNSTARTAGRAGITAHSLTEGTSKTTGIVKSAGVIPFTMMNGSLGVTYDNGIETINSHLATAKAGANITLAAKDDTEIRYEMNADTQGGLAGTAGAALTSNITRGNIVRVDGASTLFSSHDVNLYTGRGIDPQTGERNLGTFKLSLLADATNRTAIPLRTAPKLDNKMKQTNTVDIARGAQVESVRHANLSAVPGYTQAYESATEYTVWSGKGAQGSLTTTADGSKIKNEEAHNTVRADGSVTAGIHNRLSMNIRQKSPGMSEAKTKELTAKLAGMTTAQKEALAQKTDATGEERLLRDIYMLSEGKGALSADEAQWLYGQLVGAIDADITDGKEWLDKNAIRYRELTLNNPYLTEYNNLMRAYSHVKKGSTEGNNLWTTIARLKESMKAEGFVDGDTVLSSRTTIGLVLRDLAVSGGNVNIEADTVRGTGSLRAKGAPVVHVQSAAERRLIVQDVKISDAGGRVRLGEADLTGEQFGGAVHTDKNTSDSSITIHSTAQASDADIELHGDIITPGTITVKTDNSSIRSTNRSNMRAAQIHVEAPNGAVSQSSPQGTVFVGGDPLARFSRPGPIADWIQKIVSNNLEAGKTNAIEFKNAEEFYATIALGAFFVPGLKEDAKQLFEEASRHDATWVAGKDISIAARNVNINGLIQSGYPSYKIKLDASARDAIAAADLRRTEERLRVSGEQTYWDEAAAGGRGAWAYSPAVYYNAKEGYLFTDAMETGGGNVTITGALSSTSNPIITKDGCVDGRGRILARGGESDISIDTSAVKRDLHLGAITNRAGGGRVLLSDRNTGKTTEYLSNGKYRSYTIGTEETNRGDFEDAPTENGMAQYAPQKGLTYNWTGGRSGKKTQTTYSYGERFLANGHWSTGDVGSNVNKKNIEDGTVRVSKMESDGDILPNGVYFGTGDTSKYHWVDGSVYESTGEKFPNPPAVTKYYGKWQEKNGKRVYNDDGTPHMINTWWGERLKYGIYFHQWNEVTTKGTSNTYHIAADKKIGIDFLAGDGSGNVSVHTNGSLILNGGIRNISNNTYAVDLKSDAGRIESNLGRNGIVYTNNLTASAANGITLVQSAADAAAASKLTLDTKQGAIDLISQRGDVQLVKGYAGADVGIRASGSIVGAAPGSDPAVKGANITLESTGAIDLPIVASGRVDVSAGGNIKLTQQQTGGDLKVGRIQSANGDVDLTAEGGSIVDAMPEEGRLSDAEARMERWRELGLTHAGDGANESAQSAAAAKAERLKGLEVLGKAAARGMSAPDASDADVEKLYADYQALSEAYRNDAAIQAARKAYADELKASHEAGWSAEDAYARTIGMAEQAFFTQKGIVKTDAHAQTEVDKARTFIRDYKTLAQSDSYGWSANGLRYAIQKSVINATPGQVAEVKTPNIIGRNITLTAGRNKGIGEDGSKIRIANADLLKEQNLITLSNARAGEMRWTADGVEVTHTRPVKVKVRGEGKVNLTGDQRVYVVSKDSALNLGSVSSKGTVYLQGARGIYGGDTAITAARLSLYGGSGGIGTADKHLRINVTGVLDANAAGGIYIKQNDSDPLTIQAVGSSGDVVLTASKGMRMTTEEGKTGGYIKGAHVTLKSTENSLGTAADGIRIAANSLLYADAGAHDVNIVSDDNGTLLIGALKGKNISVRAVKGVEMKEDEDKAAKIEAEESADIASGEGGIALAQGAVAAKKVSLSAKNGITQSKNGSIKTNALGVKSDGAVRLLGTQNAFPALTMAGMNGARVGGSVHIVNMGGMTVSPLDVAGDLTIAQKGALTMGGDVRTDGTLTIETDEQLTAQNITAGSAATLNAGTALTAHNITAGGNATLNAGTDLTANDVTAGGSLNAKAKNITANNVNVTDNTNITAGADFKVHDVTAGGELNAKGQTITAENIKSTGKTALTATTDSITAKNLRAGGTLDAVAKTNLTVDTVTGKSKIVLTAQTGNLKATGAVHTDTDAVLTAGKDVTLGGAFSAKQHVSLTAGQNATLNDKTDVGGTLTANVGRDLVTNGAVTTGQNFVVTVGNNLTMNETVTAESDFTANVGNNVTTNNIVTTGGNLVMKVTNDLTAHAAVLSHGGATLDAQNVKLNADLTADKNLTITATKNIFTKAGTNLSTKSDGRLKARTADLGGDVHADGTLTIETDDRLAAKNITAGRNATLNAGAELSAKNVNVGGNADITAETNLTANDVSVGGDLNAKGQNIHAVHIKSTGKTRLTATTGNITAKNLSADGTLDAAAKMNLTVDSVTGKGKTVLTAQTGDLTANGTVRTDTDAVLTAGRDVTLAGTFSAGSAQLTAGENAMLGGTTDVGETLTAKVGRDLVTNGAVTTGQNFVATVGNNLTTNETVTTGSDFTATAGNDFTSNDKLAAGQNLVANVGNDFTTNGAVTTGSDFTATVGNNVTTNNIVTTGGSLAVKVTNDLTAHAAVLSHGGATLDAQNVNLNANLSSDKNLAITAKNNIFTKEGANLYSKSDGRLKAHTADLGGDIRADGTLTIETDEQLTAKNITAGNATLKAGAELSAKNVNVGGNADITAGTNLTAHDVSAGGDLNAKAKNITANNVTGKGNAVLTADKNVTLAGAFSAKNNAVLTAGETATLGGKTDVGETLTANVGRDFVTNGAVTTGKELIANVGNDLAMNDLVSAGGSASLTVGRNATLGGTLTTGGNFTVNVAHDLTVNDAVTTGADFAATVGNDAVTNGIVTTNGVLKWNVGNDFTTNAAVFSHGTTTIDTHNVKLSADLMSDKNLTITAKNNIFTKEGTNLSTKSDGRLKARTADLGGDVHADGTLTIETDEHLAAKNITAGGNATLNAGAELSAKDVNVGGDLNAKAKNITANNVTSGGNLRAQGGSDLRAKNINAGAHATVTAGANLTANEIAVGGTADLHAGKAMDTGAISADTVKLHVDDGHIHAHGAITAKNDAAVSTGTQGTITLEKTLTAGKNINLDTKRGDMLFGGDVRSKNGTITATIAASGNIGQLGGAKISVEAAAKGAGYVTLTNKGTGDIDLHRVYADRDIRTSLEHGNIHVYEMNGALVAVVLKDPNKKMALENIIAERRMIVQGSDMNLENIRVREGSDGLLSIEPAGARDDLPIENFTMGNLDLSGATGIRFERLWANNAKLKISGGRVRFDKLFIEGKADIAYAGQETSIYGTSPQIDGNVVTYWNDVNRNNPRTNKEGWTGMYLSFTGANRQESNGNLLSLSNYRFVYPQRENLVDFMGHALQQGMDAAFGGLHISTLDGKALAMQEQAEVVDMTTENAKEDAISVEM